MAKIDLIITCLPRVKSISEVMVQTGASRATIEDKINDDDLDCAFPFSGTYNIGGVEKEDKGIKVVVDNEKYSKFVVWCENNPRILK